MTGDGRPPEPAPGSEEDPAPTEAIDLEATQAIEVGDGTQPVGVVDTGPFATRRVPLDPGPLVSSTGANRILADASSAASATAAGDGSAPGEDGGSPPAGIDTLFGDGQFRDYDAPPAPRPAPAPRIVERQEPPHMTRTQRVLLAIAGALVALVALGALFFLGTRLPPASAPAATPTPHATRSTPTPAPTVLPPGPVAVGPHRWDQLLGGECLSDYPGPWAERYTVVDCATPHPAQLVFRGRFADPATPGYPGAAELQKQMSLLCSAPTVIDLAAASAYTDAQVEGSYPATATQWDAGDHWYYCFVSRASKDPLTGSVAVAHPAS